MKSSRTRLDGPAVVILTSRLPVPVGADDALDLCPGSPPLNELDPIAEGVTELEAVVAGERDAVHDFDPECGDFELPLLKVADFVSDVGFGGLPVHPVLHADVDLAISDLEPQAATPRQARRLLDFGEAEDTAIEATGLLFGTMRDGKLDVVNAPDHLIAPF
jgi:hypothetical protein